MQSSVLRLAEPWRVDLTSGIYTRKLEFAILKSCIQELRVQNYFWTLTDFQVIFHNLLWRRANLGNLPRGQKADAKPIRTSIPKGATPNFVNVRTQYTVLGPHI